MKRVNLFHSHPALCFGLLACAFTTFAQDDAPANRDDSGAFRRLSADDWSHHVRLGALVGFNISADFKMTGTFGLSGNTAPGVYADGYVLVDDTGNAGGLTANWGYDKASQVSGSTLTMHQASDFTASASAREDSDVAAGIELVYGQSYWKWHGARIGWEFGFGWVPINISDHQSLPVTATQNSYLFDTFGIVMPTAPYQGTRVSAGAPLIGAAPTAGPVQTLTGTLAGDRRLKLSLFTFKLGPSVYFDLSRRFGFYASAGPALGLVTGNYEFNETLVLDNGSTPNSGKADVSKVVFGGYVNAALVWHVPRQHVDLYLGAQYLPLGSASGSNQGREANLNLGGQIDVMAGLNWTF